MSSYYDMKEAKLNIANELSNRGWEILDYKEDESDSMTDYYSPANWGGLAKKNGFILCIDTPHSAKSVPIKKYNYGSCLSQSDLNKIKKLEALTQKRGATAGEEENAKTLIEKIKNNKSSVPKVEIIGYTTAHMANPGRCKWHIEKDGSIYDKGTGITKYRDLPNSWVFDINAMQFKDGYNKWNGKKRELPEETKKIVNDFKKLILRWERIVNCMNGMGDGTEKTEKEAQEQQQAEKMKRVIKKITKKVWKMIEVKRDCFKVGDYINLQYHGHYWKITEEYMQKGTWKGIEDSKKALVYEIVGSASRGYKNLKNPKRYYDFEYRMLKNLKEGKIKIFELKEVEEVQEIEKWVRVKTQKKNTYKKEEDLKEVKQEERQENSNININVLVKFNKEKQGIELHFSDKPSQEIREQIKINGFRWSKFQKIWFAKDTEEKREFLKSIGFLKSENNNNEPISISETKNNLKNIEYPEIDIDDIKSYTVSKELSKRENDNSMFRRSEKDHTKELQETLQNANDDVIELCEIEGCTPYIEYKAKSYLQSFKRKYSQQYISILQHRANNPSWIVTGRGGLDIGRYNKKQEQLHNKEVYLCQLIDNFNSKIDYYKNKIEKEQQQKVKIEFEKLKNNTDISNIKFKRSKTNNINGSQLDHTCTVYEYKKHYIVSNYWGKFRIYNEQGRELTSCKSLKDAKITLITLLNQDHGKQQSVI
ncbi:hypothetical protein K144316041_p21650 (plasmid) [Clostridium tetani]|uniref:hypothetical protein n=1 Tax=Clostridium tetani TaxID=1513 RepID=UPI002952B2DE|nr:hypothetical protein [Clostridium tetani]BDR74326.1 hypothetical protein K144316041_p21650 [Clostridium tetani]